MINGNRHIYSYFHRKNVLLSDYEYESTYCSMWMWKLHILKHTLVLQVFYVEYLSLELDIFSCTRILHVNK